MKLAFFVAGHTDPIAGAENNFGSCTRTILRGAPSKDDAKS
jgi:hypothetical protein